MNKKRYLITTAIDYCNDVIHIGHAYQKILADAFARFRRQQGHDVFYLTGTDEHGSKTEEEAEKEGIDPKALVDRVSELDKEQLDSLNISYDRFIRTTDPDHREVVLDFYNKSFENGDVYRGEFTGLYCVGCEEFKTERELENGKCVNHPTKDLKEVSEENYFFAWSKYAEFLKDVISNNPSFVKHSARRAEMLSFLDQGLEDIPISRSTVKFGIPVPQDESHVLYVWFDALINYVTGKPDFWENDVEIVHFLGKDNVRWHALLWPAMLKSAGFRIPTTVYGHDFFTLNGQKISKSLGNFIRPTDMVADYGADAVRYYFLRYGPLRNDVDVRIEEVERVYNSDLANGLGNLVARVAKMAEKIEFTQETVSITLEEIDGYQDVQQHIDNYRVDLALESIWKKIQKLDQYVDHNKVWETKDKEKEEHLVFLVTHIFEIGHLLLPFIPETAEKIIAQFGSEKIVSGDSLFPRITSS